jgi:nucleoside-diphosphate-sugar epimerase
VSGTVVVTGAAGGVGRRLVPRLLADPTVDRVVAVDVEAVDLALGSGSGRGGGGATAGADGVGSGGGGAAPGAGGETSGAGDAAAAGGGQGSGGGRGGGAVGVGGGDERLRTHRVDLLVDHGHRFLRRADVLVHLAFTADTERRRRDARRLNVESTRRLLRTAAAEGVRQVVVLSSATVYGAWPNNPVPLTEAAPLRPNPGFAYAQQRAQVEQLLADWVAAAPGRRGVALRATTSLGEDGSSWIARSIAAATGIRAAEEEPPKQFVHLDDVAAAVDLARRAELDGPYNVAPDGWVPAEVVRALVGPRPRFVLPVKVAVPLTRLRWRFQRGPIPPGLLPFTEHAVLIANDRLKAEGWHPTYTNEQAYVAGTEAAWWTMLSPARKQDLALGAAGTGLAALGATTGMLARRAVRGARAHRS